MSESLVLFAYVCHPERGSEPGAGWVALCAAARLYPEIHVLVRAGDDGRLEERVGELEATVHVHRVGSARLEESNEYLRYAAWLRGAAKEATRLRASGSIGTMHHITFASDWLPAPFSLMRKAAGERWVWGPVGGATRPPMRLVATLGPRLVAFEAVRGLSGALGRFFNRVSLRGRVDSVVALNRDSANAFRRFPVVIRPNAVIDYADLPEPAPAAEASPTGDQPRTGPRVMLFAGRGLDWKGLRLALRALRHLPDEWELHVTGSWTAGLIAREGMTDHPRLHTHGAVPRAEAIRMMAEADAFVLPSLHDSAPWAAGEAAGVGTPVVCLDLGGVAEMAGGLARPVASLPARTVPERIAQAVMAAGDESPAPERPWTFDAFVEFLAGVYGLDRLSAGTHAPGSPPRRRGAPR